MMTLPWSYLNSAKNLHLAIEKSQGELTIMETRVFGDFIEALPEQREYLVMGFSPSSFPLKQRWRNNGLSADFLADYMTTFFPGDEDDPSAVKKQAEIRSAVSYIANELLENTMKFNDEKAPNIISIQLYLNSDKIVFVATNSIKQEAVPGFQAFIQELLTEDPGDLYIRQLEKNAADERGTSSRLGYLTMINDYHAKLGWKFEGFPSDPNQISAEDLPACAVTTMVQLIV